MLFIMKDLEEAFFIHRDIPHRLSGLSQKVYLIEFWNVWHWKIN